MNDRLITTLLQKLDEPLASYSLLDGYYTGNQPLSFLSPEAKVALGSRLGRMASNLPRLAVTALAERLRVTGFTGSGHDEQLWADWLAEDLDQTSGIVHREALALGRGFVIVWADPSGAPSVSVESARQVAVLRDPASRDVIAAVKRWETDKSTEATIFERDSITRLSSPSKGATVHGFKVTETLRNPLGWVPVVEFANSDRLGEPTSELADLIPLVDALNKTLADMLVTSEYGARPRRWATGLELVEEPVLDENGAPTGETVEVNPIPEGSRAMIAEDPAAKFGQLPAADLTAYEAGVRVILGQIMAVSALPAHYVGALSTASNPASADALRAAEASLTARAEARQQTMGRQWETTARLMTAVRHGVDPDRVSVRVQWADAATRSVAQEADAVVKLHAAGLLPASYALKRLGYSDDVIAEIQQARRADRLATIDLGKVLS